MSVASMQVVQAVAGGGAHVSQRACWVVVMDLQELQKEVTVYGEEVLWGVDVGRVGRWQEQTEWAVRLIA